MTVAISFEHAFTDDVRHPLEDPSLQALEASRKHGFVVMVLTVDGHSVDYGRCRVMDYHFDLLEELALLASGDDHNISMSSYTVGTVRRRAGGQLEVTLFTADGSPTSNVPETELTKALQEAERRLRAYL